VALDAAWKERRRLSPRQPAKEPRGCLPVHAADPSPCTLPRANLSLLLSSLKGHAVSDPKEYEGSTCFVACFRSQVSDALSAYQIAKRRCPLHERVFPMAQEGLLPLKNNRVFKDMVLVQEGNKGQELPTDVLPVEGGGLPGAQRCPFAYEVWA